MGYLSCSPYVLWKLDLVCCSLEHRTPISGQNLLGRQFGLIERRTLAIQSYPAPHEAELWSLEGFSVWI